MSGARGFTLVELLVAMAILATLVGLAGASWTALSHAKTRAEAATIDLEDRAAALGWLRARFETTLPLSFQDAGRRTLAFTGEDDGVIFVAAPADYENGDRLDVWSLSVGGSGGQVLTVARQPLEPDAEALPDFLGVESTQVLRISGRLVFAYLEDAEGEFRWLDSWRDATQLPVAIRLRGEGAEPLHLVIPIYQGLPALCATPLGAERLECAPP